MPTALKESINQNKSVIRDIEEEKRENGWNWLNLTFSMFVVILFSSIVLGIFDLDNN